MNAEESFCAFSWDTGSGRLGDKLQHAEVEDDAAILLGAVCAIPSMIAAIFGQCGSHGRPEFVDPWVQQPTIAPAGEATRPSAKKIATSLDRIFTKNVGAILFDAYQPRM